MGVIKGDMEGLIYYIARQKMIVVLRIIMAFKQVKIKNLEIIIDNNKKIKKILP